ncbi:hypothetical protein PR048_025506 [Dryococelus australis]|uniref:Uncharacterized protein n=1 Tax=Dryococelus australis TaxID=614101 RepID=A0ABQ9GRI6_9NEOP|nr:hypothetical protein PR048_025506 [Dryococelus australis]
MKGWGKRVNPEKIRRPAASSGTMLTYEHLVVNRPGFEPGTPQGFRLQRIRKTFSSVYKNGYIFSYLPLARLLVTNQSPLGSPVRSQAPLGGNSLLVGSTVDTFVVALVSRCAFVYYPCSFCHCSTPNSPSHQSFLVRTVAKVRHTAKAGSSMRTWVRAPVRAFLSRLVVSRDHSRRMLGCFLTTDLCQFVPRACFCEQLAQSAITLLSTRCYIQTSFLFYKLEQEQRSLGPAYNWAIATCVLGQGCADWCTPYSDRVNVTSFDAELRTRPRSQERPNVDTPLWSLAAASGIAHFLVTIAYTIDSHVRHSTFVSHHSEPDKIPGGTFACGNRAGRWRWPAGFLGDLPFPPPLHSDAATYPSRFILIGSQGPVVIEPATDPGFEPKISRSRPNNLDHGECPTGMVDEECFKHIFSQFFPQGANGNDYGFSLAIVTQAVHHQTQCSRCATHRRSMPHSLLVTDRNFRNPPLQSRPPPAAFFRV